MSLLDTASLIVTPNGYKEGKLYSVIPSDGSGDLSVTRATTATRVNSAGLVELVPYNLFTYSSSFSNAAWAKVNSTVTGGQNGYDGTTNAFLITDNSTSGVHLIGQTPVVSGQHTISIYAKANSLNWIWLRGVQSSANVRAWFNLSTGTIGTVETNGTANIESIGNGWYRCSLTIANHESGFEFYYGVSNADNTTSYVGSGQSIFVQDAQLVEGSNAKDYQKTETRLNIPRLDYSNGTCPSLLVEPQRTNRLIYSEELVVGKAFAYASGTFSVTQNTTDTLDPFGNNNADKFTAVDQANNDSYTSIVGSGSMTLSIFAKKGSSDYLLLSEYNVISGVGFAADFNLTTGVVVSTSGSITGSSIEDYGNGWYRCSISGPDTSITGNIHNVRTLAGTTYLFGLQCESGSYPTSYIPTTSASVTRNADVISKTGISSLIGQTEGVFYSEFTCDFKNPNGAIPIYLKGSGNSYSYSTYVQMGAGNFNVIVYSNGAAQLSLNSGTLTDGQMVKMAFAYKANDFVLYINGNQASSYNGGTPSIGMYAIDFGTYYAAPDTFQYDGSIKSFALWKTRLTNDQLIALTTL